eukprot:TRINITY_DN536_c0_g1_i6.p1 TRINITY_DN536_c0_g1~~TRINITY_DN536_c0_g1_i6.p1  ORF type:complete len:244 (+),score=48.50 TRINITY_DN536_c0_g1_i6:444-1175(+)
MSPFFHTTTTGQPHFINTGSSFNEHNHQTTLLLLLSPSLPLPNPSLFQSLNPHRRHQKPLMFARRSFTSLTRAGESSSNRGIVNGLLSTFNTTDNTESSNTSLFSNQQDNGIYIRNMATLKEIKNRKVSVENIEKITASMKMVAAAKLKGVEKDLDRARSYIKGTDAFFSKVETDGVPEAEEGKRNLVVALTSDRGLCGGVNRYAALFLSQLHPVVVHRHPNLSLPPSIIPKRLIFILKSTLN